MKIRIATRGSDLALTQARYIARRLERELQVETELLVLTTQGDRILDRPLAEIGGKGLFIKEIEEALVDGRAEVAVHSAKDLPAQVPEGLQLSAYPQREDCRDALVAKKPGDTLESLPKGARVGTGSVRRTALLKSLRPDLKIVPLRGNVQTRLNKLVSEDLDAIVLACAGLDRLGLSDQISERLDPTIFVPAATQGILALETRANDPAAEIISQLNDPDAAIAAIAERAFLGTLEGDCSVPLAGYACMREDGLLGFDGLVSSLDGKKIARTQSSAPPSDAAALGRKVANKVLAEGGDKILKALGTHRM
jgi:hydroxymethylbilane synthase